MSIDVGDKNSRSHLFELLFSGILCDNGHVVQLRWKMGETILRDQAINTLSHTELEKISKIERADILACFSFEDWGENIGWIALNPELRAEIEAGMLKDPEHKRFNEAIIVSLSHSLRGVTNDFLLHEIQKHNKNIQTIEGQPLELIGCPCCGYNTLDERGEFDICSVCWWEDDGQDNARISIISETFGGLVGGPNRVELALARYNFLSFGICNPDRMDLKSKAEPQGKFVKSRFFIFEPESKTIKERGTDWECNLSNNLD